MSFLQLPMDWTGNTIRHSALEKVRRDMREESKVYPDTPLSYAAGFALAGEFSRKYNERTV